MVIERDHGPTTINNLHCYSCVYEFCQMIQILQLFSIILKKKNVTKTGDMDLIYVCCIRTEDIIVANLFGIKLTVAI